MENIAAQSYSELVSLECAAEELVQPKWISVERREWLSLRWAAGYWKKMHTDMKMRHELLLTAYSEVCRLNGAEMKLQRKVRKLERLLAGLTEVEVANNIVSRQGRKIKQLQKESRKLKESVRQLQKGNRELKESVRQWELESEHKDAVIAGLQRMLFGSRSEKKKKGAKKGSSQAGDNDRPRRKAAKKASRKRHDYSHLDGVEERCDVEAECSVCGKAYVGNGSEESELIEIEVRAYRRLIRRPRKRSTCQCGGGRELVAAAAPRLFPNTRYGVGFWAHYLFQRYSMHQTVGGFCRWSESYGVVHGDETSWRIQLAGIPQGENYRGWLWICVSEDCVSVHIDRHRSAAAASHLFADRSGDEQMPALVCDRYRAYKKLAREMSYELAFCWAHVRRDFIDAAAGQDESMRRWLERFGQLFHTNKQCVKEYDSALPMSQQSEVFRRRQTRLEDLLKRFF